MEGSFDGREMVGSAAGHSQSQALNPLNCDEQIRPRPTQAQRIGQPMLLLVRNVLARDVGLPHDNPAAFRP